MNKDALIEKLFLVINQFNDGKLPEDLHDDYFEWMTNKQIKSSANAATGILWKSLEDDGYRWSDFSERGTDKMYHELAKYYAFNDYEQCEVPFAAYDNGHPVTYCGWEPNMVFRFKDMFTDEDLYECQHMEWEH